MRHTVLMLFLCLCALFVPASGHSQEPLKLVCDIWPPYQTHYQGTVTGFSTQVVHAVLENMGAKVESTKAFPWQRALEIIRSGDAHALFSANHTPDRETFARYPSEPIVESPWTIWTKDKEISQLTDLKGLRIGVVQGYSYTPEFWNFIETFCDVELVHSDAINFKKLSLGRLDAVAAEYGNGIQIVRSLNVSSIRPIKSITIKTDGLYVIFNKRLVSQSFVDTFSQHLSQFKKSEKYQNLYRSYFWFNR